MCKHPLFGRYASGLFSVLKLIYNFMLFSDEAVYTHLTAQLDAARGSLPGLFGFVSIFFNYKNVAKDMVFSPCPRYACFHAETFLLQLCKDPFNCVSFKTAGKEGYGTCPSSPLSLISGPFPEHE